MAINLGSPVNKKSRLNQGLKIWSSNMVPGLPMGSIYRNLADPTNHGVLSGTSWMGQGPTGGANSIAATSAGNIVSYNASWITGASVATYACWIYRSSTGNQVNVGNATAGGSGNNYGSIWYTDGNIYNDIGNSTYGYCALSGTGWHHIISVFDGSLGTPILFYIDGIVQSLTIVGAAPSTLPTTTVIHLFEDQTSRYGVGNIADYRLYDRALSATECYRLYNNSRLGYFAELNRTRNSFISTPPAAGSFKSAWARNSNIILMPGALT